MERTLNKLGFLFILFLLIWAPLPLASNRQWAWSLLELFIFFTTACALLSYPYLAKNRPVKWNNTKPLWFGLALLPLTALLQSALWFFDQSFTYDIGRTLDSSVKGIAYLCYALSCWLMVNSEKRLKLVITVIVLSALFQALYGTALLLGGFEESPIFKMAVGHRATGSFVYQNHFANFLMMSAALGAGLMLSQFQDQHATAWRVRFAYWLQFLFSRKMLFRLALIMIVAGLVLSKSRMGNSAFFISLLICSLTALLVYKERPRIFTWFIVSIIAIDVLIVGSWVGLEKVQKRLEETVIEHETRVDVIEYAIPAVLEHPWLGHGAGSFYSTFNQYQDQWLGGFYDHAHNDYLQFAYEYGLLVLSLLSIPILWAVWLCISTMQQRRTHLYKGVAFGCMMAVIGMLIHCSVDFHFQAPANTLLFVTILCITYQCRYMPRGGWRVTGSRRSRNH